HRPRGVVEHETHAPIADAQSPFWRFEILESPHVALLCVGKSTDRPPAHVRLPDGRADGDRGSLAVSTRSSISPAQFALEIRIADDLATRGRFTRLCHGHALVLGFVLIIQRCIAQYGWKPWRPPSLSHETVD